jgi:hypothetical protein
MNDMFPATQGEIFGVKVPLPADQATYLTKVYGQNWRIPDPFFSHDWRPDAYADLF